MTAIASPLATFEPDELPVPLIATAVSHVQLPITLRTITSTTIAHIQLRRGVSGCGRGAYVG
jgi:hypothetical protein